MHDDFRRKNIVQNTDNADREFNRWQFGDEHRAAGHICSRGKTCGRFDVVGKDATGEFVREEFFVYLVGYSVGFDLVDVCVLASSEYLEPLPREQLVEPRKCEARAVEVRDGDFAA